MGLQYWLQHRAKWHNVSSANQAHTSSIAARTVFMPGVASDNARSTTLVEQLDMHLGRGAPSTGQPSSACHEHHMGGSPTLTLTLRAFVNIASKHYMQVCMLMRKGIILSFTYLSCSNPQVVSKHHVCISTATSGPHSALSSGHRIP